MNADSNDLPEPEGPDEVPAAGFTVKEARLALLLACGDSNSVASKKIGIAESTAWRWRKSPVFQKLLLELRAALISETTGKLAQTACQAAAVLNQLLSDSNSSIKLGAARTVLERATEFYKLSDMQQRLENMEAELEGYRAAQGA